MTKEAMRGCLTLKVLDKSQSLLPGDDPVVRLVDEVCQHENRDVRWDLGDLPRHILESPRLCHVEEEDYAVGSLFGMITFLLNATSASVLAYSKEHCIPVQTRR